MNHLPLILASRSPRRRELLEAAGYDFVVMPPNDEQEDSRMPGEPTDEFVCRLACRKAWDVFEQIDAGRIIACDTVVLCDDEILGKPVDRRDAGRMLRMLRGKKHVVQSGLCLLVKRDAEDPGHDMVGSATTELFLHPITDDDIDRYLESGRWRGKAGAFGYQDGNSWITILAGSESNVVGMPMELLRAILERSG